MTASPLVSPCLRPPRYPAPFLSRRSSRPATAAGGSCPGLSARPGFAGFIRLGAAPLLSAVLMTVAPFLPPFPSDIMNWMAIEGMTILAGMLASSLLRQCDIMQRNATEYPSLWVPSPPSIVSSRDKTGQTPDRTGHFTDKTGLSPDNTGHNSRRSHAQMSGNVRFCPVFRAMAPPLWYPCPVIPRP